ncbi:unnamed protein product [Sphagnum tenellum]
MVFDAEKVRFAVEYVTRVANEFNYTNMFFVKNCSVLLGDIPPVPTNGIHSEICWGHPMASLHSTSVMLLETEELVHFRGRDPVSAYPLIRLTRDFLYSLKLVDWIRGDQKAFPEPFEFLDLLLASLSRLVMLIRAFEHSLVSREDVPEFQIVIQVEVYDLTSSERVKRGVKRAWLIGETLALETGSEQNRPNIHRTKYKGVRFRPSRSRTKPWTAEVKPPMEKNKVWIDDCNTPEAAAHAYDVAAFYSGKGNKALNFEHTPRFLPKTLEYSCAKEKKHAIQEQARHLRRNPLFYLIHHLPYDVLFCFVMWELFTFHGQPQTTLALLIVKLMRLVRKDSSVIAVQKWVSLDEEIADLHAHTNIPQLLESIDCLIKKSLQQKQGFDYNTLNPVFSNAFLWSSFWTLRFKAQGRHKVNPLTLQFIEWVRINLVTPQTTSMEAKDLPASPSQCNVRSIMSVEIDLRAPQTSSMAMEAEGPLVNIPPQCNTLSMHYPHELIQDTSEQDLIIWHKFSLESQHLTYQDATPEEQVVQSPIAGQAATIVLSTPVAAIAETSLLPFPPLDVGIPNEGYQTGDLYKDIQDALKQDLRNLDELPLECEHLAFQVTSPEEDERIKSPTDQAATEFLDLDDGEDLATLFERPQHDQLGDIGDWVASDEATLMEGCNPDINDMVLTSVPGHIEGNEINSLSGQAATIVLSTPVAAISETLLWPFPPLDVGIPNEGYQTGDLYKDIQEGSTSGQMKSSWGTLSNFHPLPFNLDQAATEFLDLDEGEDPATLFEWLQHDPLGDIGDPVASVEATLMEGCNPGINDMVLTSVPGEIEGNEINSLCEYEHVMEPPRPFAFSHDLAYQAATYRMDLHDGEHPPTSFERPQHDQLGGIGYQIRFVQASRMDGYNPDINDMVVTSAPGHSEGNEINSFDQAATYRMDLHDGEHPPTSFERPQHDQLGGIGDQIRFVQASRMEGDNPDINAMVVTSVPGHIEGNEVNSFGEYEDAMERRHHVAFSQQPFVQFDEYL